jgi:hypothetical protein
MAGWASKEFLAVECADFRCGAYLLLGWLGGRVRIDSDGMSSRFLFRVSSAVDCPPGEECFTGGAFGAVVVAVKFHQLGLEEVAGVADEFDVGGGDEYFWDVGVVVH